MQLPEDLAVCWSRLNKYQCSTGTVFTMFPIRRFVWKHPVVRPFSFVGLLSFQVPPGVLDSAENWGKLIYSMQTTVLCKDPCCSSLKTHQMILNATCILYCHKTAYWEYALHGIFTRYRKKNMHIYFISAPEDRKKGKLQFLAS